MEFHEEPDFVVLLVESLTKDCIVLLLTRPNVKNFNEHLSVKNFKVPVESFHIDCVSVEPNTLHLVD